MRQYDVDNTETEGDSAPKHYEWQEAFLILLKQPNVASFKQLLRDPQAKAQRAYLWMILPFALNGVAKLATIAPVFGSDWLAIILFGAIAGCLVGLSTFVVGGWVMQRLAIYHGSNVEAYSKFHYLRAAYMPLTVLASTFALLIFGASSAIYGIVLACILIAESMLTAFALQAVNEKLAWNKIVVSVMVWYFFYIMIVK